MSTNLSPSVLAKFTAAQYSVSYVEDGMKLGLGTGSTAAWMVRALAKKIRDESLNVTCVATSQQTAELAQKLGLNVTTLDNLKTLDLVIDGADEFDPRGNLIKGGGAALLCEKIVAAASDKMLVITDASKQVQTLGAFPLPVEVVQFGWATTQIMIEKLLISADVKTRQSALRVRDGAPVVTDEGHYILDLQLDQIGGIASLTRELNQIPGVVENGLFIDLADNIIIGDEKGDVKILDVATQKMSEASVDISLASQL